MSQYGKWKMENGNMELHFETTIMQMRFRLHYNNVIRKIFIKGIFIHQDSDSQKNQEVQPSALALGDGDRATRSAAAL